MKEFIEERKSESWFFRGEMFLVEVKKTVYTRNIDENIWCVYFYLYPKHKLFDKFKTDDMFDDLVGNVPFHCGCTYSRWHHSGDKIECKEYGCDYNHIYDDRYLKYKTKEEAYQVFRDAKELFDWLSR